MNIERTSCLTLQTTLKDPEGGRSDVVLEVCLDSGEPSASITICQDEDTVILPLSAVKVLASELMALQAKAEKR